MPPPSRKMAFCGRPCLDGSPCHHLVSHPGDACSQHSARSSAGDGATYTADCVYALTADRMNIYCITHNTENCKIAMALGAQFPCTQWERTWCANAMLGQQRTGSKRMPSELVRLQKQHPYYNSIEQKDGTVGLPVMPVEASKYTLKDPRATVRSAAARNARITAEQLRSLWAATDNKSNSIRRVIVSHRACPEDVLQQAVGMMPAAVARRKHLPANEYILSRLVQSAPHDLLKYHWSEKIVQLVIDNGTEDLVCNHMRGANCYCPSLSDEKLAILENIPSRKIQDALKEAKSHRAGN